MCGKSIIVVIMVFILIGSLTLLGLATGDPSVRGVFIWLPGTQPGQADAAASVETCRPCHAQQVQEWFGSMMAHAVRDPMVNALRQGMKRSVALLLSAAKLEVVAGRTNDSVNTIVRVVNLTGHKLPTGFSEGRRMWVNIVGKNSSGEIVFQSGVYDSLSKELLHDSQLKVYEAETGMSPRWAAQLGFQAGISFIAALNDNQPSYYLTSDCALLRYIPHGFHEQ